MPTLDFTLFELTAALTEQGRIRCKSSYRAIELAWRTAQRAGWAWRVDGVRGVLISVPVRYK